MNEGDIKENNLLKNDYYSNEIGTSSDIEEFSIYNFVEHR